MILTVDPAALNDLMVIRYHARESVAWQTKPPGLGAEIYACCATWGPAVTITDIYDARKSLASRGIDPLIKTEAGMVSLHWWMP